MATRIKLRRGTTAEWASANPVLAEGEPGLDLTLGKVKYGDGVTEWSELPFAAADVELPEAYEYHVHEQESASASWSITHNLGRCPSVTIVDSAGTEVVGDVQHVTSNEVHLTFAAPFSGKAYLN